MSQLPQALLTFGLPLLENVWDFLFPSVSSWLLRASESQAPATESAPNPVANPSPLGGEGEGGFGVLGESVEFSVHGCGTQAKCPLLSMGSSFPKKQAFLFFFS